MDHMRISGTEPSSVILSQTMKFKKLKSDDPKVPNQAEAKRDKFRAKIALKRRALRDVIMLLLMTSLAKERETAVKSVM